MRIGVCDDNPTIAKILVQLLEQSMMKLKIEAEIISFSSGYSLIKMINEFDAVFLDIEMPEMDGFEVGRVINERSQTCKIIMATGKVERFKESFKINAFRFVTKPFDVAEIEEAIEAMVKMKIGEEVVQLYFNRLQYDIPQKEIKFIKAFNGYSEVIVKDKCFRKDLSLNELEELLDKRLFVRIHKKYIVNMYFVEIYKNSTIKIDEKLIPVSRRKQKEFENRYINFEIYYRG